MTDMKKLIITSIVAAMGFAAFARVDATVDFSKKTGRDVNPWLHCAGFAPSFSNRGVRNTDELLQDLNLTAVRTHDWALLNAGQRIVDTHFIFPLMHLDPKDPKNYYFKATDDILALAQEKLGVKIAYRLGTSIEHSGKTHYNILIPEDYDKYAEVLAGIVRHYTKGWANGYNWDIKYWEIWNEPDGITNCWGGNGESHDVLRKKFIKLFVTVLKRLKSEFPELEVGGPALCWLHTDYFKDLLLACKEAGVAPDFISWHNYGASADGLRDQAKRGRELCDKLGFTKTKLIINEWHFFGNYSWSDLRSRDPVVRARTLTGPGAHNGIDAAVFTLETLAKFQTSKYDQAYYYGCRHNGSWGFKDYDERKYKTYYALKMFGDIVSQYTQLVDVKTPVRWVTPFAGLSADGKKGFVFVSDYGGRSPLVVDVAGVAQPKNVRAVVLDYTRNLEPVAVKWTNGRLELPRKDANSVAFLVTFDL